MTGQKDIDWSRTEDMVRGKRKDYAARQEAVKLEQELDKQNKTNNNPDNKIDQ